MRVRFLILPILATVFSSFVACNHVNAPEVDAPLGVGWHPWTDVVANPTNARNVVACGARWLPSLNVMHSFVYASFDGGQTWRLSLVDSASDWVTEQSCAFGAHGELYFNSEASETFDGGEHHNLGQLHLYRSDDGGKTWRSPIVDGWFDHSAMAISNNRTVFLFANCGVSAREYDDSCEAAGLRLLRPGASALTRMIELPPAAIQDYSGAYPSAVRVLPNGNVIAVMYARHKSYSKEKVFGLSPFTVDAVWWDRHGRFLSGPSIIGRNQECGGNMPAMDVDRSNDPYGGRIYVAWSRFLKSGALFDQSPCAAMLSHSDDGGRTWISSQIPSSGKGEMPVVAVNGRGVVGVAWGLPASMCWVFAFSRDGGKHFSKPVALNACRPLRRPNPEILQAAPFYEPSAVSQTLPFGITVRLGTADDWRSNMAADADGTFHLAWPDPVSGSLWVSQVTVNPNGTVGTRATELQFAGPAPQAVATTVVPQTATKNSLANLREVDTAIGFRLDGAKYDAQHRTVTAVLHLFNQGNLPLAAPFVITVDRVESDFGRVEFVGPSGGYLDVSAAVPAGVLAPLTASDAVPLAFRLSGFKLPSHLYQDRLVSVKLHVWTNVLSH